MQLERINELLDRIKHTNVLVIGDIMLDVYLRGKATRISPEAPVPVVNVESKTEQLGGAANVAMNAAVLGANCSIIGCVGNDDYRKIIFDQFQKNNINATSVYRLYDRPTTVKTRILAGHQQIARYDQESDVEINGTQRNFLYDAILDKISKNDVVIIQDYDKGVLNTAFIEEIIDEATVLNKPVIVDPKSRHFFDFSGATIFKPNYVEMKAAFSDFDPFNKEMLSKLCDKLGCRNLLVTMGEFGMLLANKFNEPCLIPATAKTVYDVSGAGDTVAAVLGVVMAAGGTVYEAARLANYAAGVCVSKSGIAQITPEEIRLMVNE